MSRRRSSRPLTLLSLAAALATGACNSAVDTANDTAAANSAATAPLPTLPATLPLATGSASAPRYAPAVAALPAGRAVRTVRVADPRDGYAYADDAYAFNHALGDAPPDYGFDYGGSEPWAWQGYDGSRTFVEPVADGYRYYYYRPDADQPYFVRDPDYGYGYDNGALAVIYAASGAILPFDDYGPRLGYASRYLWRGENLYRASLGNDRRAVIAANWAARRDAIAASRDRWAAAEAQQAGWQAYRARVADQQAQHWAQEAQRRDADARRFAGWHDDGFRGAPPPRAIPVAWQQAPWAQDAARYRPAADAERPRDQARPGTERLVTAGGVGLAAGAAGFAAHRFLQGPPQAQAPQQRFVQNRGPGGGAPGPRAVAGPEGPERLTTGPGARQPGAEPGIAGRQRDFATGPRVDRGPQGPQPQRNIAQNRPAQPERAQPQAVRIHRGSEPQGFDAPRQAARGPERAPEAQHGPGNHADRQAPERQQPAFHAPAPAFHQPSAQQHAAPAPMQHSAAPAPHPQGGGGGMPHGGGGGGAPHGGASQGGGGGVPHAAGGGGAPHGDGGHHH